MAAYSSSSTSTEESALQTRDKIISLAYSAFSKNGYSKTSLKTISEELNITRPALYYHFPSKEDLFIAVYENIEIVSRGDIQLVLSATNGEEFKRELESYFNSVLSGLRGDDERVRFVATAEAAATEMPSLREKVHANSEIMLNSLERIIDHGINLGIITAKESSSTLAQYLSLFIFGTGDAMLRHNSFNWTEIWPIIARALFEDAK